LPARVRPKSPVEVLLNGDEKSEFAQITIPDNSPVVGKRIVDMKFPKKAIIAMINRDNKFITPEGSTVIQENDVLMVFSEDNDSLEQVKKLVFKSI